MFDCRLKRTCPFGNILLVILSSGIKVLDGTNYCRLVMRKGLNFTYLTAQNVEEIKH